MKLYCAILSVTVLCGVTSNPPLLAQQESLLHGLDRTAATARSSSNLPSNATTLLIARTHSEQIRSLLQTSAGGRLLATSKAHLPVQSINELNEHMLADVYNDYVSLIGAPSSRVESSDIHAYRRFLSLAAPHMIPMVDGQVSARLSPAEALFILDTLFSQGYLALPVTVNGVKPTHATVSERASTQQSYVAGVKKYCENTPSANRQAWMLARLKFIPAFSGLAD